MIIEKLFHVTAKWVLLTLLIVSGVSLNSQEIPESVHYHNYTINDGLPSNETYDVFHDSKGFLWIGTDNGVVRYDGQTFETFTTLDGLTDNTIFKIEEDYLGRIWFMTYNRKLCYYEDGKFKEYWFNEELAEASKNIFIGNTITSFNLSKNNDVDLLLSNQLSISLDSNGEYSAIVSHPSFKRYFNLKSTDSILAIIEPLNWTNGTFNKLIIDNKMFGKCHFIKLETDLYLGTNKGLYAISPDGLKTNRHLIRNYTITDISIDFEGGVWCSSLHNGVFYLSNTNLSAYQTSIKNNSHIFGIIPQNDQLVYSFGKKNNNYVFNYSKNSLLPYNMPLSLLFIPEHAVNLGLKFENPFYIKQLISTVNSISRIDANTIIFSSSKHGLILIDNLPIPIPKKLYDYFYYPIKKTYLDGYKQNWIQKPHENKFVLKSDSSISNRWIEKFTPKTLKIFTNKQGKVWLGTTQGIYMFDKSSDKISKLVNKLPFSNHRIQDITESTDSTMFFATKANGIYSMKDSSIINYTTKNGLLSNTIYQLVYDSLSNRVWITTNSGICILTQNNIGEWVPKPVITKYDGLKSKDIRQMAFQNGYLFFANNTGVSKIKVSNLFKDLPPPILYLKEFISNGENQALSDAQIFPYDSNNIQLEYHAISYKSLNDVQYQYQLLPIDTLWRITKNGHINFQALQPSEYTFKIRAINIDGIASPYQEHHFTITPAFWMTFWFKGIIIIIAVYFGYQLSMRSIRNYRNQANMEKSLNKLRVISLQAKMNPHFIFNSLNSIQNFILKNEKEKANDYLLEFSKLIRIILQNSDSTTILLLNELDTLKLYVGLEMKRLRNSFKYTTRIDPKIDLDNCKIPSLLIQPYVENAIWHGKVYNNPDGEISIEINLVNNRLHFDITDNGIGIKNAGKSKLIKSEHNSLGSQVTKKRIELLSDLNQELSEVKISENIISNDSTIYVGTHVSFSIPYHT